jgi:hypothetical protein
LRVVSLVKLNTSSICHMSVGELFTVPSLE